MSHRRLHHKKSSIPQRMYSIYDGRPPESCVKIGVFFASSTIYAIIFGIGLIALVSRHDARFGCKFGLIPFLVFIIGLANVILVLMRYVLPKAGIVAQAMIHSATQIFGGYVFARSFGQWQSEEQGGEGYCHKLTYWTVMLAMLLQLLCSIPLFALALGLCCEEKKSKLLTRPSRKDTEYEEKEVEKTTAGELKPPSMEAVHLPVRPPSVSSTATLSTMIPIRKSLFKRLGGRFVDGEAVIPSEREEERPMNQINITVTKAPSIKKKTRPPPPLPPPSSETESIQGGKRPAQDPEAFGACPWELHRHCALWRSSSETERTERKEKTRKKKKRN